MERGERVKKESFTISRVIKHVVITISKQRIADMFHVRVLQSRRHETP